MSKDFDGQSMVKIRFNEIIENATFSHEKRRFHTIIGYNLYLVIIVIHTRIHNWLVCLHYRKIGQQKLVFMYLLNVLVVRLAKCVLK